MTTTVRPAPAAAERWMDIDRDGWTRHVVRRHFHPETGSPYWLRQLAGLPFDPWDITGYDELSAFGVFDPATLRTVDPADLVPRDLVRPLAGRVWESAGTVRGPCRVFYTASMAEYDAAWRARQLRSAGFEPGRRWLYACPSGPHLLSRGAGQLARHDHCTVYAVDLDQRWIKRLMRDGKVCEVITYVDHVVEQIIDLLDTRCVDYLETSPALLQVVIAQRPELVARLAGVGLGGTHLTPAMYRDVVAALGGGVVGLTYGSVLGHAMGLPVAEDGGLMPYLPGYPQVTMAVVDPDDPGRIVRYGELGRVRLTVLHEDLFLPNVLKRDQALRYRMPDGWPCDGVANVAPLEALLTLPTGLY